MAQNEDKSIALGEVVVKAAKTVNKMDGMVIYPTEVQKKSSTNGYETKVSQVNKYQLACL